MKPRYKEIYEKEIVPALDKKFGYKNPHERPRLDKIVINMGVGEATQDRKHIDQAVNDLSLIAGQNRWSARQRNPTRRLKSEMASRLA